MVKVRCYPETSLFGVQGMRMKRCQSDFDPEGETANYHFYFLTMSLKILLLMLG